MGGLVVIGGIPCVDLGMCGVPFQKSVIYFFGLDAEMWPFE